MANTHNESSGTPSYCAIANTMVESLKNLHIGAGIVAPSASTLEDSHMNTVPFFPSPPSPPDLTHLTATDLEPTTLLSVVTRPAHNSNTSRLEPPSNPRTPCPPQ